MMTAIKNGFAQLHQFFGRSCVIALYASVWMWWDLEALLYVYYYTKPIKHLICYSKLPPDVHILNVT